LREYFKALISLTLEWLASHLILAQSYRLAQESRTTTMAEWFRTVTIWVINSSPLQFNVMK